MDVKEISIMRHHKRLYLSFTETQFDVFNVLLDDICFVWIFLSLGESRDYRHVFNSQSFESLKDRLCVGDNFILSHLSHFANIFNFFPVERRREKKVFIMLRRC
jgi:hypothetical protein